MYYRLDTGRYCCSGGLLLFLFDYMFYSYYYMAYMQYLFALFTSASKSKCIQPVLFCSVKAEASKRHHLPTLNSTA